MTSKLEFEIDGAGSSDGQDNDNYRAERHHTREPHRHLGRFTGCKDCFGRHGGKPSLLVDGRTSVLKGLTDASTGMNWLIRADSPGPLSFRDVPRRC